MKSLLWFGVKDLAVVVVMVAAFVAILSYPLRSSRGSIAGANVLTSLLGVVVFSVCAGYFTRYEFVSMVLAFILQVILPFHCASE